MRNSLRALALLFPAVLTAADLSSALTFRANFDGGLDAQVGRGDKAIYCAPSYKEQAAAAKGIAGCPVEIAKGQGRKGDALRFTKKNTAALFYKAQGNVPFDAAHWTGTLSFWLSLDPERDLEPGYCDPIQLTDKDYNNSAIWVDFTRDDKPRHFRLGVFGELKSWNPTDIPPDKNPNFSKRLVVVPKVPFARGQWTHVAVTFTQLGGGQGSAKLYLNGELKGSTPGIAEPFAWDLNRAALRLGVNYVGLIDDVAYFNRELTAAEVASLAKGQF